MTAHLVPGWARDYQREWLRHDLIAGLIIWSVVTPQAVAYAQIAGLPPESGLIAAPVAMFAYALVGTSHQLVVSATTATSAVSLATVGPLAGGDPAKFAALSAMLALVTGVVLVAGGWLRFGAVADLVSKPVMTGFLFGLGLTIMLAQAPSVLGVKGGDGDFFPRLRDLVRALDGIDAATLAVGAGTIVMLVAGKRVRPAVPWTLIALGGSIALSALLDLKGHGVDVVGDIPQALPDLAVPHVGASDIVALFAPALGVLILSAEAVGVARSMAQEHGYRVDPNRDLVAMGASNLATGLTSGFVQSGGASQTAAADSAGARSQLASVVSAGLLLLTGAFLAPLFEDLPQATLAAIVIVAVAGFLRVDELRRFAVVRRSAIVFAGLALTGVLVLGVLQGLIVTAGLSLVYVIQRLSRPSVRVLVRDSATGAWRRAEDRPDRLDPRGVLVVRSDATLLYPNANAVKDRVLDFASAEPRPWQVVLDMSSTTDIDLQTADTLGELADALRGEGIALTVAHARAPARGMLERSGVDRRLTLAPTIEEAVRQAYAVE